MAASVTLSLPCHFLNFSFTTSLIYLVNNEFFVFICMLHCVKYHNFTGGNCAFPQNFHTRKLGEITTFYVVLSWMTQTLGRYFLIKGNMKFLEAFTTSDPEVWKMNYVQYIEVEWRRHYFVTWEYRKALKIGAKLSNWTRVKS